MKKDERLQQLFHKIRAGQLSRNRNFSAYLSDDVAHARGRSRRFERLLAMLDRASTERWQFRLAPCEKADEWLLECRSPVLVGFWKARLYAFELHELGKHADAFRLIPNLRTILDSIESR